MDTLDIAFAEARRYLASLDTSPVAPRGTPAEIRAPLPVQLPRWALLALSLLIVQIQLQQQIG